MTTPLAAKIAREYGTPCRRHRHGPGRAQHRADPGGLRRGRHRQPAAHQDPQEPLIGADAGRGRRKGITCQKLGEAEVMAEAGIDDILISYNLIGEEKMARLAALQARPI